MIRKPLKERFLSKIELVPFHECWEWVGAKNSDGYGNFGVKVGGKHEVWKAHRVSYILFNGPLNHRKHVMHTCDNRGCVNPRHLILGNHKDNMRDMVLKGRSRSSLREDNVNSKLTLKDVNQIRSCYTGKWGEQTALAKRFGVKQAAIWKIVNNIRWED